MMPRKRKKPFSRNVAIWDISLKFQERTLLNLKNGRMFPMLAMELLDGTLTGCVALSQDASDLPGLPFLRLGSPYRPSLLTCNWKGNTSNLYKTTASDALTTPWSLSHPKEKI